MNRSKGQALGSIFADFRQEPPARAPTPPAVVAFLAIVDRVETVLEAETSALAHRTPFDMTEIGNRKRQGLLDMTRMIGAAMASGAIPEIRERLGRFSVALKRNQAALGTQLRAVREIAEIVAQAIRDAESDGTYSPRTRRS